MGLGSVAYCIEFAVDTAEVDRSIPHRRRREDGQGKRILIAICKKGLGR